MKTWLVTISLTFFELNSQVGENKNASVSIRVGLDKKEQRGCCCYLLCCSAAASVLPSAARVTTRVPFSVFTST